MRVSLTRALRPGDRLLGEIDRPRADANLGRARGPAGPPPGGTHPRDELGHVEWLGQVVVGARIESQHLVGDIVASRQHDDGRTAPSAQVPDDLQTRHVGQTQINDNQGGRAERGGREAGLPADRDIGAIATCVQGNHEDAQDLRLVVDEEDVAVDHVLIRDLTA